MSLNPRITDWPHRVVWLIGASSGIGLALAEELHARGARVVVSARTVQALQQFVDAHPGSMALPLDATQAEAVQAAASQLMLTQPPDLVCYCAGHYKPMRADAMNLAELLKHQAINVSGALHVLAATVPALLARGHGHLSVISSVAGFRGLPQGLAYGPTKAALINLCETLYLDLHARGLGVSLITPGFVATPLTVHNDFRMPAVITPQAAARAIVAGWERGDFHLHFPRRFTFVMKLLRLLPYRVYFPLVRRITGL